MANKHYPQQFKADAVALYRSRPGATITDHPSRLASSLIVTGVGTGTDSGPAGPKTSGPARKIFFERLITVSSLATGIAALTGRQFVFAAVLIIAGVLLLLSSTLWRGQRGPFLASIALAASLVIFCTWFFAVRSSANRTPYQADGPTPATSNRTSASPGEGPVQSPSDTTTTSPPVSASATPGVPAELMSYLADCGIRGSIQRVGPAEINGTTFGRTVWQTPNGFDGTNFELSRKMRRFQATVGIIKDANVKLRVYYELRGDGQPLWSGTVPYGKTVKVDEPVVNVLTLTLMANEVGEHIGGVGTAGWGDARVTGAATLSC